MVLYTVNHEYFVSKIFHAIFGAVGDCSDKGNACKVGKIGKVSNFGAVGDGSDMVKLVKLVK